MSSIFAVTFLFLAILSNMTSTQTTQGIFLRKLFNFASVNRHLSFEKFRQPYKHKKNSHTSTFSKQFDTKISSFLSLGSCRSNFFFFFGSGSISRFNFRTGLYLASNFDRTMLGKIMRNNFILTFFRE